MFKLNANAMFNNFHADCPIILGMNEQMERLYQAAKHLHQAEGSSAVAKLLNVSPQTVHNWEARGISNEGLLRAQELVGCDAIWLRDGTKSMTNTDNDLGADEIIELVALYQQSTLRARQMILDLARSGAKRNIARWTRVANN